MATRNLSSRLEREDGASSSSSQSAHARPPPAQRPDDDSDELVDFVDVDEGDLLENDPLNEPLSFKRKQKQSILAQPARLLSNITGIRLSDRITAPSPISLSGTNTPTRGPGANPARPDGGHVSSASKDGLPLDWYVEGPGRRVGYEDLTAIDWIFEYTKERQRLRVLYSSATGVLGYVQQLLDASQVWVILVLTGLAVGAVAAGIDVTTDWLGDLKRGYCASGSDGGAFYLNRGFCCMGYDTGAKCAGWRPWAAALGVGSAGGKWFIEYIFFIVFSITFAVCSGFLVQEYAPYAKHSGIPEIKTVLGGFIIKRFLGAWTLVTKSLGLVCLSSARSRLTYPSLVLSTNRN